MKEEIIHTSAPTVKLENRLNDELLSLVEEEGLVFVHCSISPRTNGRIRIWNSTILFDQDTGQQSRMLHAMNITIAPEWMKIKAGIMFRFLLIFSSLRKNCILFDLFENAPGPGAFIVHSIKRNKDDVYHVKIA